ncbi:MAG: hypothetical protein IJ455_00230 [Agathobacter sp.]|nr:hypothetical protein [Agathobacter sp.]
MQTNSNSQIRIKPMQFILAILLTILALNLFNPITAYADYDQNGKTGSGDAGEDGKHYMNGVTENGTTPSLSFLYWAGDTSRSGYIMYIVDTVKDEIQSASQLGIGKDTSKLGILMYPESYRSWNRYITDEVYYTHYGKIENAIDSTIVVGESTSTSPIPNPVRYVGNRWQGNTEKLNEYLFDKVSGSFYRWQLLFIRAIRGVGVNYNEALDAMNSIVDNDRYAIIIEPIGAQAVYGDEWWSLEKCAGYTKVNNVKDSNGNFVDAYQFSSTGLDSKYYFRPNSGTKKPVIDDKGRIVRTLTTGIYAAEFAYQLSGKHYEKSPGNPTWLHEALPYSMTLDEDFDDIKAITDGSHQVDKNTVFDSSKTKQTNGYAMVVFTKINPYINTYDVDTNPKEPAPSQKPSEAEGTDGRCTIVKLYYDTHIDLVLNKKTTTFKDKFETIGSTGYIQLTPEESINGYAIDGYFLTESSINNFEERYKNYGEMIGALYAVTGQSRGMNIHTALKFSIDNEQSPDIGKNKYIYIIYNKATKSEEPDIKDYDFEIPESYITKQVFFSQANLTNNTLNSGKSAYKMALTSLDWVSEKFKCPGHEVFITCDKGYHPQHVYDRGSEINQYLGYDCLVQLYMYNCDGDDKWDDYKPCDKKEHIHGSKCFAETIGVGCKFCYAFDEEPDAQGKYEITHKSSCHVTQGTNKSSGTLTQLTGGANSYYVPIYEYKNPYYLYKCPVPSCSAPISYTETKKESFMLLSADKDLNDDDGNGGGNNNSGIYVWTYSLEKLELLMAAHKEEVSHRSSYLYEQHENTIQFVFEGIKCLDEAHKHAISQTPFPRMPEGGCPIPLHNCLTDGCIGKTKTVYCKPTLTDGRVQFEIKNTLQGNNPSIQANVGKAFNAKDSLEVNQKALSFITSSFAFVPYDRTTTSSDNTNNKSVKFDYSTILLRGDDKIKLAKWLKDSSDSSIATLQTNAINTLTNTLTNQFYVGNTPQGDRKLAAYENSFSAKFESNATNSQLSTTVKFDRDSDYASSWLIGSKKLFSIGGKDVEIPWLKPYSDIDCDNQSRTYTLQTPYEIPSIKVKVNVFSDYTNQNPGTPIHGDTTISFYPYVRMYYDTPTLKNQSALVLGETQRHFQAHDGADITFTNGTGQLTLTTSQWYLAKMI